MDSTEGRPGRATALQRFRLSANHIRCVVDRWESRRISRRGPTRGGPVANLPGWVSPYLLTSQNKRVILASRASGTITDTFRTGAEKRTLVRWKLASSLAVLASMSGERSSDDFARARPGTRSNRGENFEITWHTTGRLRNESGVRTPARDDAAAGNNRDSMNPASARAISRRDSFALGGFQQPCFLPYHDAIRGLEASIEDSLKSAGETGRSNSILSALSLGSS
jgi:hypothetical protein